MREKLLPRICLRLRVFRMVNAVDCVAIRAWCGNRVVRHISRAKSAGKLLLSRRQNRKTRNLRHEMLKTFLTRACCVGGAPLLAWRCLCARCLLLSVTGFAWLRDCGRCAASAPSLVLRLLFLLRVCAARNAERYMLWTGPLLSSVRLTRLYNGRVLDIA